MKLQGDVSMTVVKNRTHRIALLSLLAMGIGWAGPAAFAADRAGDSSAHQQDVAMLDRMSAAFRTVAKQVKPAVVQVRTIVEPKQEKKLKPKQPRRGATPKDMPGGIDPKDVPEPFREFFEDFGDQQPRPQYGSGSGVIIDAEQGLILTNNHVVGTDGEKGDKDQVRLDITLNDGRSARATVVGQDPKTDIAVLRIRPEDMERLTKGGEKLRALPIGDSTKMDVGDWVLAIGAPFGLAETVTQGIISAKGRNNVGIADIGDFLQTDAAINPGNSGGPLVNMHGELIGINTAIATSGLARGNMGVGFAIPTEMIKQVLPDLKEGRKIVRGYLGVSIKGLEQEPGLARTFGLNEDRGVVVNDVRPDTPASKAGLKPDDVILSIGGKKVESVTQLQNMVTQTKPGQALDLVVWRDAKQITIPVKIEAQPEDFYANRNWGKGGRQSESGDSVDEVKIDSVGITVTRATPELAKKYGWDPDEVSGQVIVTEVEALGEAGASKISPGDIILSVQGKDVKSPAALKNALTAHALAQGVRLRIKTENGTRILLLQVAP
jgi:serine protease Do